MTNSENLRDKNPLALHKVRNYVNENLFNGEGTREEVDAEIDKLTRRSVIDAYFTWEGICGYTDSIISLVSSLLLEERGISELDFDVPSDY
jgi:hypothetical protein